jgi:hypothetical protein
MAHRVWAGISRIAANRWSDRGVGEPCEASQLRGAAVAFREPWDHALVLLVERRA